MRTSPRLLAATVSVAAACLGPGAWATPIDPLDPAFTSLGLLPAGSILFDTDALTFNGTSGGVLQSQAGAPDLAVFVFDTSILAFGDTITGVGSRPLALLFQGNFTINGTIDVSGQDGGPSTLLGPLGQRSGGPGGAGGPGGGAGGDGNGQVIIGGSAVCCVTARAGDGPGGGGGGGFFGSGSPGSGGGGSFGSMGRDGSGISPGLAGSIYGSLLVALEGGSGGGGGGGLCCLGVANNPGRGGGGGGGGLEIAALALLEIVGGTIIANGGHEAVSATVGTQGGGGSGGGLLLHAFDISLDMNTVLGAMGGDGSRISGAGCGGGGRISLVTNTAGALFDAGATINTDGGFDPANRCAIGPVVMATDANVGVASAVAVGEPTSEALIAIGLALLGMVGWRRRWA